MAENHATSRLEAFCDGVFAIALTLLIIEIKHPAAESIATTSEFWGALQHLAPAVFAFVLSFGIILITWVNHHAGMKLVRGTSPSFIYANGFLLLTVVFVPFPTGLLGEFILTDHAAPAVFLYNAVVAVQAIGWILCSRAALKSGLARDDVAATTIRENGRNGYFAFVLYSVLALAALWFPLSVAIATTLSWIFWLVLGIRMKHV